MNDQEREVRIWLTSRTIALALYGWMGIQVGLATMFTGAAAPLEDTTGPLVRVAIGGVALLGGLLTFIGSMVGDRTTGGWCVTLVGSMMLAVWALGGFIAFSIITVQIGVDITYPWRPIDPDLARLATPLFYESILLIILLHVITLIRLGRPSKR